MALKIKIEYDTVSFASTISCNSTATKDSLEPIIEENKNRRILDWIESLIKTAWESNNHEGYELRIEGCDVYEQAFVEEILPKYAGVKLDPTPASIDADIQKKYDAIDAFINAVQIDPNLIAKDAIDLHRTTIDKLRAQTIEIPVIATMSSGKSTLLNALIGQDFLPEDSKATTATTCTIEINNKLEGFEAIARYEGGGEEKSSDKDIVAFLKSKNDLANNATLDLTLKGPVQQLDTKNFNIHFVDTPGPNSARHENHKSKTYAYLKDNEHLPIVVYVLDPEKMDSKDDDETLNEIKEVLESNKRNLERIIFVVNKIDREIASKRKIKEIVDRANNFLENKHIKNAKIFPISAQYAKFAQIDSLDEFDKYQLTGHRLQFKPHEADILEHAPLTKSQKENLANKIQKSDFDADLVYSGLAALRLYIEDYIANQHKRMQYHELLGIRNRVWTAIQYQVAFKEENLKLLSEEEKKKQDKDREDELNKLIEQKEKIKSEIKHTNISSSILSITKIDTEFDDLFNKCMRKEKLKRNEARTLLAEINATLSNLQISINTDLTSKINDALNKHLKSLREKVEKQFHNIKGLTSISSSTFQASFLNRINTISADQLQDYEEKRDVKRTKQVPRSWWLPQLFRGDKTVEYSITLIEINSSKLYNEAIRPIKDTFDDTIRNAKKFLREKESDVNNKFNAKIDEHFKKSQESIYKKLAKSKARSEQETRQKLTELKEFKHKLEKEYEII